MSGDHRLGHAFDQYARGLAQGAIDTLAELLGDDPDDATAHALLAMCLVQRKRIHAADVEAGIALSLAPEHPFVLLSAGWVAYAHRRFADAEAKMLAAIALEPDGAYLHVQLARFYHLAGRHAEARVQAEAGLELDSDAPDAVALLGAIAFAMGERERAAAYAGQALADDPENTEALVLLGQCQLARGDAHGARERAIEALFNNPEDGAARALLCAVKASENWFLGLWWRFQSWLTSGNTTRAIALLVGMYVAYRSAVILLQDGGSEKQAQALQYLWLGFCVYTWVAPGLFARSLKKEMQTVALRRDF